MTTTGGNSATCTSIVTVEDKIAPVLTCPNDTIVSCSANLMDLDQFGSATVVDNCPVNLGNIMSTFTTDLNVCLLGIINRSFTVSDGSNSATCVQEVTVIQDPAFTMANITCPPMEVTLDGCIDLGNIFAGTVDITLPPVPCVMITVDSTLVDLSPATSGVCVDTFLKTFTILDECTSNSFLCQQTIILDDGEGPVITCSDVVAFLPMGSTDCEIFIDLPVMIIDSCQMNPTGTNDSEFADNNNIANAAGTYPGGVTPVTITATDPCGNTSMCDYTVTVVDTFASILSCEKIIESIQANQLGVVTINQASVVIDSNCPDDSFMLSFSATDNSVDQFLVDCADAANTGGIVPGGYTVYLYAGTTLLDSCNNLLQVLDGASHCTSPLVGDIVGRIFTETDDMLPEVMVELDGLTLNDELMTVADGFYAFENLPLGQTYRVTPTRDGDDKNGISTLDLVIMQRHILGLQKLDTPYKIIAADINNDNKVNGIDLIELRKLILGLYAEYPLSNSWRMVDADYDFVDSSNPFATDIPEEYVVRGLEVDRIIDFIGVKVGDVNGSARTNFTGDVVDNRSNNNINLWVPEVSYNGGSVTEIVVSADQLSNVVGFQYALSIDTDIAEVLEFTPLMDGLTLANVNLQQLADGYINFSWVANPDLESMEAGELFSLTVRIHKDSEIEDFLSLDDDRLMAEAYTDTEIKKITLESVAQLEQEEVVLYQNIPNPWSASTEIRYSLPESSRVLFNLYDVNGKVVKTTEYTGEQGMNSLYLEKGDMPGGGIYFYEVITGSTILKQKMLHIK